MEGEAMHVCSMSLWDLSEILLNFPVYLKLLYKIKSLKITFFKKSLLAVTWYKGIDLRDHVSSRLVRKRYII